ncbi:uncharacterized protein LOC117793761 [Drosophila innubila]|uniref:uncharacterized protein LOC117793761 n=1 Tax=Drosophila innubila TaxID=198719 RepID=UPI00148D725A|nr:uncharacterized protein LOC117793761 [Drosophila innubila]
MSNTSNSEMDFSASTPDQVTVTTADLQFLLSHQVNMVMDQFYSMYSRAYDKLENAIMGELMPRLRYTKKGHDRLVHKVMRRLEKLRPFAQSPHRTSSEQIIKDWECESVKNQAKQKKQEYNVNKDEQKSSKDSEKQCAKSQRKHKKRPKELIKEEGECYPAEYRDSPVDVTFLRKRLSSLLRSINSSNPSSSVGTMMHSKGIHGKDVRFIYQNQTFPPVPISEIAIAPNDKIFCDDCTSNLSRRESHRNELSEYDRNSLISMLRLAFPSNSKYHSDHKKKHKRIYKP